MPTRMHAKVRVVYRLPGQRKDREAVGIFHGKNHSTGYIQFQVGPGNTLNLRRPDIKDTEVLAEDAECFPPRIIS